MLQRTETGWRGDCETSVQHNDSLNPAGNTAVGERKKEGEKKNKKKNRNWMLFHFVEKRRFVWLS